MQNGFVENTTGSGAVAGYELVARFDRIDGISVGTDVRMSGIKIGTVTSQVLDQKTYRALVRMSIRNDIKVPEDSSIKVATEGLLGGTYLAVSPGGSDAMLVAGGEFETTQGSIDLVGLLGKAMFSGGEEKKPETPAPEGPAPAPAPTP
jgi:phospholipid/cholesterol/gamma-HCH transport system substrate-binding protein